MRKTYNSIRSNLESGWSWSLGFTLSTNTENQKPRPHGHPFWQKDTCGLFVLLVEENSKTLLLYLRVDVGVVWGGAQPISSIRTLASNVPRITFARFFVRTLDYVFCLLGQFALET